MADSIERYFFGKDRSPEPIVVLNSVQVFCTGPLDRCRLVIKLRFPE